MTTAKYQMGNQTIDVRLDAGETLGNYQGPANFAVPADAPGNRESDEIKARVAAGTLTIEPYTPPPPPPLPISEQIDRCISALSAVELAYRTRPADAALVNAAIAALAREQPDQSLCALVAAAIEQGLAAQ